MKITILI